MEKHFKWRNFIRKDKMTTNRISMLEIIRLQVRHLVENLRGVEARGEKIKHVHDANPHPADARAASALLWIDGDSV